LVCLSRLAITTSRRPPYLTFFPYTTLFRSLRRSTSSTPPPTVPKPRIAIFAIDPFVPFLLCVCAGLTRPGGSPPPCAGGGASGADRKSTRLNSSHVSISYAVFCLEKKKKKN